MTAPQRFFKQIDVFVRHAFAEPLLNFVADCRSCCRTYNAQQRGSHHSESEQWSDTWNRQTGHRQARGCAACRTHCSANRCAHGLAHSRLFSVCNWNARFQTFRTSSRSDFSDSVFRYTKTS
jgi:hypothetical protein